MRNGAVRHLVRRTRESGYAEELFERVGEVSGIHRDHHLRHAEACQDFAGPHWFSRPGIRHLRDFRMRSARNIVQQRSGHHGDLRKPNCWEVCRQQKQGSFVELQEMVEANSDVWLCFHVITVASSRIISCRLCLSTTQNRTWKQWNASVNFQKHKTYLWTSTQPLSRGTSIPSPVFSKASPHQLWMTLRVAEAIVNLQNSRHSCQLHKKQFQVVPPALEGKPFLLLLCCCCCSRRRCRRRRFCPCCSCCCFASSICSRRGG